MIAAPDLTLPVGSTASLRRVLGEVLRARARALGQLPLGRASPSLRASARTVLDAVRRELASEPGRVLSALRRPTVSAPLRCLLALPADANVDPLLGELCDTLALELAQAGSALPRPARGICLSGRFAIGREAAFHPIERDLVLALVDNNPLAMMEAHPDKHGNAIDLGGQSPQAWCDELRADLALLAEHLPLVREEMDLVIQQIVPVGYDPQKHLSASYQEAVGTIYLTLHPQRLTMVEALIHELQHNKLNAVLELDRVLEDPPEARFASPVRPDPRPLLGILLAVHAFVPVALLYRALIAAGSDKQEQLRARMDQIVEGNRAGLAVLLEHAHPTPVGRALLDELAGLA